jgi:hypothetical protein
MSTSINLEKDYTYSLANSTEENMTEIKEEIDV